MLGTPVLLTLMLITAVLSYISIRLFFVLAEEQWTVGIRRIIIIVCIGMSLAVFAVVLMFWVAILIEYLCSKSKPTWKKIENIFLNDTEAKW